MFFEKNGIIAIFMLQFSSKELGEQFGTQVFKIAL